MTRYNRRRILYAFIIILVFIIPIGVNIMYNNNDNQSNNNRHYNLGLHIGLKIYKNGRLVYYDPDDPPVKPLFDMIANSIVGKYYSFTPKGTTTSYILNTVYDVYTSHITTVVLVTSNTPPSNDVEWTDISSSVIKGNKITQQDIKTYSSTGDLILTITKSVTITSQTTIYGVGWISVTISGNSNGAYVITMLDFYDYLNNPINANASDVITVVYEIHLPVSSQYSS